MLKRVAVGAVCTSSLIHNREQWTIDDQCQSARAACHHVADTIAPGWDVATGVRAVEGLHQIHDLTRLQAAGAPWITFVA